MATLIHYSFHFLVPLLFAYLISKDRWMRVYLIFLCSMLVDLDHLLADPIFDPTRCSINFHPLHTYYAMVGYALMLLPKSTRILGFALLWHMLTDYIDCLMQGIS